ncbi:MAG: DUF2680 domain-containing protein [Bacillota bacterium]|jgi:hypothetical protein
MNVKKLVGITLLLVGVLGAGAVAYAAGAGTPAEVVAELTGQPLESIIEQRGSGDSYGAMAAEADLLEEFQQKMLELKKEILDRKVAAGQLTQEEADQIYQALQANLANCPGFGVGGAGLGKQFGAGLGCGGYGQGMGFGRGMRALRHGGVNFGNGRNR